MYIDPHKRNVDALLKVVVIIKVVVFPTYYCVVARIALATGCCCCTSIRSASQIEGGLMLSEKNERRAKFYISNGTLSSFFAS